MNKASRHLWDILQQLGHPRIPVPIDKISLPRGWDRLDLAELVDDGLIIVGVEEPEDEFTQMSFRDLERCLKRGYRLRKDWGLAVRITWKGVQKRVRLGKELQVVIGKDFLRKLKDLGGVDADHWISTQNVASKLGGDADNYKATVKRLKSQGLILTKEGRAGGICLTPAGLDDLGK